MNKIYKKLLVAAGAVAMLSQAAPASAAPTLAELTDGNMQYYSVMIRAFDAGLSIYTVNTAFKIERVGNTNNVIFRDFYKDSNYNYHFDIPATYDPTTGVFTITNESEFYYPGTTRGCGRYFLSYDDSSWEWRRPLGDNGWNYPKGWFPDRVYSNATGTVEKYGDADGLYRIQFNYWNIDDHGDNIYSPYDHTHEYEYFARIEIVAYPANATVTEDHYRSSSLVNSSSYGINLVFNNESNFEIINFNNRGSGYINYDWDEMSPWTLYNVFMDGVLNDNGTVSLGNRRGAYSDYDYDARVSYTTGQDYVFRDQDTDLYYDDGNSFGYYASYIESKMNRFFFKGLPNGYNGSVTENIAGTWSSTNLAHNNYGTGWSKHVNGGTCETRSGDITISLNPYMLVTGKNVNNTSKGTEWYKNTKIVHKNGRDVTFNAIVNPKISHKASDTDSEGLGFYRFNVSVSDFVNTENIESVEVYYIEGAHNHCSSVNHSKAVKMGTIKDFSAKWDSEEKIVYPTVTKDPHTGVITNINKDYSFYLKANYKTVPSSTPETKQAVTLDPTYHALTAASSNDITTAVDLNEATGLNVEDVEGGIIVHAEGDAAVQVYNMSGMLVAAGNTNETIAIDATGVMVVRVNGKVFKIMK